VFTTDETRCTRDADGTHVLTFTASRPEISPDVLDALERALDLAEQAFAPLVVASESEHFAFGANLDRALAAAANGRPEVLDAALERYQRTMLRLRHASVPTVAAVRGLAVSGGCELLMHCTRVVEHPQSFVGLGETSIGLIGGGRWSQGARVSGIARRRSDGAAHRGGVRRRGGRAHRAQRRRGEAAATARAR
jgi:3-hydroxyacyl-CoA dehydrogenase